MKKTCILLALFVLVKITQATHIIGGQLSYQYVSSQGNRDTYRILCTLVRDCSTSQVDFDYQLTIGIYYPGQSHGKIQKVGDTIVTLKSQNAMLI